MRSSKICKQKLTVSKANYKGCPPRASLYGSFERISTAFAATVLLAFSTIISDQPLIALATGTPSPTGASPSNTKSETPEAASETLRHAAMEYAEACNFENARSKLEEDITGNQNADKTRLPESYLLLGNVYRLEGLYPEAREWTLRGVSGVEKIRPRDAKRLSAAYNYLALFYNSAGEFADSEQNARKALDCCAEAGLGKENEAMHRVVLANALRQQGKYKEALPELEKAVATLKSSETKSDKDNKDNKRLLAAAINNLGALFFWMGDYHRAMPLLQDGLKIRLDTLGENHPDVANSYLDLGCVEFRLGDTNAALDHLQDAHEIRLSKLGANHPETLSSAANLGVVLLSAGQTKRALELLSSAVETGKTVLGKKNPDLAQYEDDLANALAADKQFDQARAAQAESNQIRKAVFGSGSREFAGGLRSLAQIESAAGNKPACKNLLLRSIAIYTAIGQHPDPDLADTLDELGYFYTENNELENARQTFVLAIREKLKTGNSVSYATSLANLAELLHRMHHDAESAVMLKKAATAIETLPESLRDNPDCKAILERYKKSAKNGSPAGDP